MNVKLIFLLSGFGFLMAIATIAWIPANAEPIFWLVIFIICAYLIAKNCTGKYFLHGLLVSIANSIWITAAHIIFVNTYLVNHPRELEMMSKMPMPTHPRIMILIIGPIVGIFSGIILGLFAFIASKLMKKKAQEVKV
ncbi:MAG: hypothetical protein P4L35_18585 [Ignavibacteriaceae bacterium]|nr:hypothetical protein [Ignavibacteriaceae bacterium]